MENYSLFGFGDEVPNPEAIETFTDSKLKWDEVNEGKHAEMLTWAKELIKLRHCTISLNDGSMQHLMVSTDEARRTLVMVRDEVRVVVNFGTETYPFEMLDEEELKLMSHAGIGVEDGKVNLPGMSLAVLMSSTESAEDREVH